MSTTVRLEGRALELAQQMIDEGICATLDEAVARSLAIAHLHDTAPDWEAASGEAGDVARLTAKVQERADSGALGENAPELWRLVRQEVELLAARQAQ